MKKTAIAMSLALLVLPTLALADSDDTSGEITAIDKDKGSITLSDGKTYMTPSEFNFDGLKPGVKVVIYYSTTDGKRVIDDLQTE
ncbi:MAG TPA: DUF1344 domain-containing protein [Ensifer sp.]|nr:DUF1344 domain-containing protein [Ensifer sp.]